MVALAHLDRAAPTTVRSRVKPLVTAYFVLLLVFTVVRNTPWGSALYA